MKERKLTKKQLQQLKSKLISEKEKLVFNNVVLSDDFNISGEDKADSVDQANAAVSTAQSLRFRNRENFYVKKITESIRRIDEETYGECDECEENIGFKRLDARPTAELCIMCKEDSERDENVSIFGKRSKSLGKQIQLAASS